MLLWLVVSGWISRWTRVDYGGLRWGYGLTFDPSVADHAFGKPLKTWVNLGSFV